jgi:hypothetical protein
MPKVLLMGGLGNQLFQLAELLSSSGDDKELIDDLGNPRVNSRGQAEILSFKLPHGVQVSNYGPRNVISRKLLNFGIRFSARASSRNILIVGYELISTTFDWITFKRGIPLHLSAGTGIKPDYRLKENSLNVGYFQSAINCRNPKILSALNTLVILQPSETYLALKEKAVQEKPLIVHIRLGDYLLEDTFGIPSEKYYEEGIRRISQLNRSTPIWLFSNEPNKAFNRLPSEERNRTYIVPETRLSSAETLDLMRYGSGYVIANSTFSWWGAMLTHTKSAPVIIPIPWFKTGIDPEGIFPEDWQKISGDYSSQDSEFGVQSE